MDEEGLDRRRFLGGLAALGILPASGVLGCGAEGSAEELGGVIWLSAQGRAGERPGLAISRPPHREVVTVEAGFRGHDVAANPARPQQVVLFGRRPGTEAIVVDLFSATISRRLDASPGKAFQGHGFFTPDGAYLVTSEADLETAAGWLVIRRTDSWGIVDELESHGLGPHEILLMPDRQTVAVANGGLLTRPETGASVLNLDSMDSSLAYVDLESGDLLEAQRVPEPKASLRHLDVAEDGTVAFGLQVQREATGHTDVVPLAGVHRRGEAVRLFDEGLEWVGLMRDYVGSVAVASGARVAGFTSPRGNLALFWDIDTGARVGHHELSDCCGLAVSPERERFVSSSSVGEVRVLKASDLSEVLEARRRFEGVRWDNHLVTVRGEPDRRGGA